ncbi:hypothetical protein ACE10X_22380 [Bradyrhizobium sp. Pha-3]|uniref:hypothetical protein n=1 Tax=Bradyrhizobium sp. Pha-3 TaxID=208375 RepID=UPI0035D3EC95
MAGKNDIVMRIALEGAEDVQAKLKRTGEIGKQALQDTEKRLADAGNAAQRLAEPISRVSEALAPVIEQGGIAGALGGAGPSGVGGLISRLASGFLSPAGLVAGVTGSLIGLAKLGEETDRYKARLKGLGGNADAFGKLSGSAKELGTDVENLQPGFEKFLTYRRDLLTRNKYFPIFEGSSAVAPATDENFLKAQGGLLAESRVDKTNTQTASAAIGQFFGSLFDNKLLTTEAVKALQQVSPNAANFVARSVSPPFGSGRPFKNADELIDFTDRGGRLQPNTVIDQLARKYPQATADAEAARGVTEAFENLEAATKRLTTTMGGDHANLTKGIDTAAGYVDKTTEGADRLLHAKDYLPGGGRFIGPVRPEDVPRAPQSLSEVFSSDKGDLLGRFVGYLRNDAASGINGGNPFGVITDFVKRAITDPGSIGRPIEAKPLPYQGGPNDVDVVGPNGKREIYTPAPDGGDFIRRDPNSRYNWPIAPGPTAPAPSVTPEQAPRVGEAQPLQQTADLSGALRIILESISAAANNANKPDLKVDEPASGGIRGEGPSGTAVADASQVITAAGDKLAAALEGVASRIEAKPASVQVASGGEVRKNMDGGGHVSGPGTTTSDSIPARLSDGEYVIRASSARKIGRSRLDQLNANGYADGGDVSDDDGVVGRTLASATRLGPGQHTVTFDPGSGGAIVDGILHLPGDPLLDDPVVKKGIAESKAGMREQSKKPKYKSWFKGRFGHSDDSDTYVRDGGAVGHFAEGGLVGNLLSRQIGLPHLAGGGATGFDMGSIGHAPTPALERGSGSGEHHTVDLRTNAGDYPVKMERSVLDQLKRESTQAQLAQGGIAPSWYR